jgi:hypothetical protein
MNHLRVFLAAALAAAVPARAVYAPIPDQELGKDLVFTFALGVSHDSNIFGAATNAISSAIVEFAPKVAYNASVTDQTFLSFSGQLTVDQFDNRPGEKTLNSFVASARVAHAFSQTTTLDVIDVFQIARNPESLLNGVPLNTDQSFQRNELNGTFTTALNAKVGLTLKARTVYYEYRNALLGRSLDRIENLFGASGDYAVLPEVKAVAEFRHQDVYYKKLGETKNKNSDFLMGGADYAVAKKLTVSARAGAEWRHRNSERSTTAPTAELSAKYDYADGSFVTGGYVYTIEEASDTTQFTDNRVNRFFVNLQHTIRPLLIASGSFTYEPSTLQGRRGFANVAEDTFRSGVSLSYLPTKQWTVSFSYDNDHVSSAESARNLARDRVGLNASYAF